MTIFASSQAWRVADVINYVVHRWQEQLNCNKADEWLDEGRVDIQLVVLLVAYAHRQGLSPADLDVADGYLALRALAEAVATDRTLRNVLKHEVINASYGGKSALLTGPWDEIIKAAQHLLERQPRRYAAER